MSKTRRCWEYYQFKDSDDTGKDAYYIKIYSKRTKSKFSRLANWHYRMYLWNVVFL